MRYLKAVGLTALAALAMSAMLASTASAKEGELKGFYAASKLENETKTFETSTLIGKQYDEPGTPWNFFEAPKGSGNIVSCDNATFTSTIEGGTQDELTVEPHYEECQAANQAATVTMNGCDFIFTQPTTFGSDPNYTAKVALTCPHENRIKIDVFLFGNSTAGTHSFNVCSIEVWPTGETTQSGEETKHRSQEYGGESHVILDKTTEQVEGESVDDVTIKATVEGITFDDNCNGEEGENGIYKNTVTATAWNDEGPTHDEVRDAWIEEEEA